MQPETIDELLIAWRSDLANFDMDNPENTAGVLLARLVDNDHCKEWSKHYPTLQKISDLLIDIEGVPSSYDEVDHKIKEHHRLFDEVEDLISDLEDEIVA
ncbi:MAG: hypothetical protein H6799_02800 [Candidatus Nomurabacteria bacterium]|nr:MAG: hypothetical protein H6799_02800 [Candidatus Nomurabacteria bacterium]HRV75824.1 hypothetical protein [Candidatus Saccharimonadales bacterium]